MYRTWEQFGSHLLYVFLASVPESQVISGPSDFGLFSFWSSLRPFELCSNSFRFVVGWYSLVTPYSCLFFLQTTEVATIVVRFCSWISDWAIGVVSIRSFWLRTSSAATQTRKWNRKSWLHCSSFFLPSSFFLGFFRPRCHCSYNWPCRTRPYRCSTGTEDWFFSIFHLFLNPKTDHHVPQKADWLASAIPFDRCRWRRTSEKISSHIPSLMLAARDWHEEQDEH